MNSEKNLKTRLVRIFDKLLETYGRQACPLDTSMPHKLMVATILSAQCTDKQVNRITPVLFKRFPDLKSLAEAEQGEIEKIIKPAGVFRNKAKNIKAACEKVLSDFDGKVPSSMEELTSLPGIGRKTANVILGNAFGIPGFPVDTHVKRLMNRIGIVKNQNDPAKIEKLVTASMPEKYWTEFSHLLISHGRSRCPARSPQCPDCEIKNLCDTGQKTLKKLKID